MILTLIKVRPGYFRLFLSSGDIILLIEYTNDSQVIPRSTSVIAKRLPAARPGKGKAAMYIAGASSSGDQSQAGKPASHSSWTRPSGPMSKRFDRVEPARPEPVVSTAPTMVREISSLKGKPMPEWVLKVQAPAGHEDEAEALKRMFQATEDHWKETGEKMSTLVLCNSASSSMYRTFPHLVIVLFSFRKVEAPRFTGSLRSKPQHTPHQHSYHPYNRPSDKPLPASYVCYRCGQKGMNKPCFIEPDSHNFFVRSLDSRLSNK